MKSISLVLAALVCQTAFAWTTVSGTPSGAEWQMRAESKREAVYASRPFLLADVRRTDANGTSMLVVGVERASCTSGRGTVVLLSASGVEVDYGQWSLQNNNVASALAMRLCRM